MTDRLHDLSLAALYVAASGALDDEAVVAQRLYRFGSVPRGPRLELDFGPGDDPMAVLGLTAGGCVRRLLDGVYEPSTLPGWYSFARQPVTGPLPAVCKLYISPRPQAMADAFPRVAATLAHAGVRSFKVGRGLEGLLRCDKIVAYFDDRAHLDVVARALRQRLRGCVPQGVPFTADAGGDGLLSWGIDPPAAPVAASWRSWLTRRLARHLVGAPEVLPEHRVARVLAAVRREAIDPDMWLPGPGAFEAQEAS